MKFEKVLAERKDKVIYKDGDKCIKVFDENYKKSDILNEALNQARVEETGLNIPKIHEVTKIDGKWAIVTDFIEGKTLAQLMEENPDKEDEYLNQFVDIQLEILGKKAPLLTKLWDKMSRKIDETTLDATTYLQENGVLFMPGKAANAGGVATSALEMSQNSMRLSWTREEVDEKLHNIMIDIFHKADDAAKRYGMEDNYVVGANIAGFEKVVDAMKAQGIV